MTTIKVPILKRSKTILKARQHFVMEFWESQKRIRTTGIMIYGITAYSWKYIAIIQGGKSWRKNCRI